MGREWITPDNRSLFFGQLCHWGLDDVAAMVCVARGKDKITTDYLNFLIAWGWMADWVGIKPLSAVVWAMECQVAGLGAKLEAYQRQKAESWFAAYWKANMKRNK